MEAVIFDIDGTLVDSSAVDGRLFASAVLDVLGQVEIRHDWMTYPHVTDGGILREILRDNGIAEEPAVIASVKARFVSLVRTHIESHGPFAEIPGARAFVNTLNESRGTCVAYATGGWRDSAQMKLASTGFPVDGIPLSTADDFDDRISIMRLALSQLPAPIDRVTYYGDGAWGRSAAESLSWRFVPVGRGLRGLTEFHPVG